MEDKLEMFASNLTTNRETAKDLLQETYLKVLLSKDKFIEFSNFNAWVYTIMKNTFINNYRKAVRQNTIIDTTKDLYYLNNSKESNFVKPDSSIQLKEINGYINNLPDKLKLPLLMRIRGFHYKEIAEGLDLKLGTVKSRIFVARKKLTKPLIDFIDYK
jgi:RNA polymerase sigma-70 factor (ECF subfamily)